MAFYDLSRKGGFTAGAASLVLDRFKGIIDIMIQIVTNIKS
jgi:glycerol-3-phosphate acyltransferase PlsY